MAYAIMRHKKHKLTGGGLKSALMHLYREQKTPNANPNIDNMWFTNDGEQTSEAALRRLHAELGRVTKSSGRKLRKDAVVAVEYVMTASPEWFSDDTEERNTQAKKMAVEARRWLRETYPEGQIIAAQIHMDETTPHLSIFITPTHKNDDRLSLSAREILGGREKLSIHQDSFADHMRPLGLDRGVRGSKANHESVNRFYGRLKAFEGKKSELVNKYRAEIDKIDSKMFGGKAELIELAKLMSDDLATLQSNYKLTIARQSREAEEKRLREIEDNYKGNIRSLERELKKIEEAFEETSKELRFIKKKNNLYNEGLVVADEWREGIKGEKAEAINDYVAVMTYEVESRLYSAGMITQQPQSPYKRASPKFTR